jgi:hypothetical protein
MNFNVLTALGLKIGTELIQALSVPCRETLSKVKKIVTTDYADRYSTRLRPDKFS